MLCTIHTNLCPRGLLLNQSTILIDTPLWTSAGRLSTSGFRTRILHQEGDYSMSWNSLGSEIANSGTVIGMSPEILKVYRVYQLGRHSVLEQAKHVLGRHIACLH